MDMRGLEPTASVSRSWRALDRIRGAGEDAGVQETFDSDSPFAPDGTLWWRLERHPHRNQVFGGERRLAAYLWFELQVGDTFTMRQLRAELGDGVVPKNDEHLNRRLRELRKDEWILHANRDDPSLRTDEYRLVAKGRRVWLGERRIRDKVSKKTARIVFDRDDSRCVICGVGAGEGYPGEPGTRAKLTIGHRIPGARLGGADPDNLRTECSRCNEPVRDQMPDPESYDEVITEIRSLPRADAEKLRQWLIRGERTRSKLDLAYGRARRLSTSERRQLVEELNKRTGYPWLGWSGREPRS